jgi:hypothetical protein
MLPASIRASDCSTKQENDMNHSSSADLHPPGDSSPDTFGGVVKDSIRYWESHRIVYNLVLTAVVLGWLVMTWPHFQPAIRWRSGLLILVLTTLANACYCAAYPVDLLFQCSKFQAAWKRRRWILWSAGVVLAVVLACYWIADEIYPDFS